jgi:hypothetical protein
MNKVRATSTYTSIRKPGGRGCDIRDGSNSRPVASQADVVHRIIAIVSTIGTRQKHQLETSQDRHSSNNKGGAQNKLASHRPYYRKLLPILDQKILGFIFF